MLFYWGVEIGLSGIQVHFTLVIWHWYISSRNLGRGLLLRFILCRLSIVLLTLVGLVGGLLVVFGLVLLVAGLVVGGLGLY